MRAVAVRRLSRSAVRDDGLVIRPMKFGQSTLRPIATSGNPTNITPTAAGM